MLSQDADAFARLGWTERYRGGIAASVLENPPSARISDVHRGRLRGLSLGRQIRYTMKDKRNRRLGVD